ncbi:hypothetical protein EPH_0043500 [Eimeria praecox]|uniref:DNA topoisomerase (ATP-hydrolyzing) n=1 Tax=Eimeria praecox TaxID=51316 RepID=U6G6A2_9EIME|nr:hypothetical protein EPH_0043500 [Eimeria praecox]
MVEIKKLEGTDQEGLVKLFRLKSSLSTQNYHLFNAEGKVQKYADELEIMKDFAAIRLTFYEKRKAYLIAVSEKEKSILHNRVRFITSVLSGELIVSNKRRQVLIEELFAKKASNKRRQVLIEELFAKGYDPMRELEKKCASLIESILNRQTPQEHGLSGYDPMRELEKKCASLIESILNRQTPQEHGLSDKESVDEETPSACGCVGSDFDYLVGMPMWSLTAERVDDLKRQLRDKEVELEGLRQTDIRTLWLKDLDALLEAIEKQDAADMKQREADLAFHKQLESKKGLKGFAALKGKPKATKGAPKAAPKVGSAKSTSKSRKEAHSSSEESISSSEDSDESSDEVSLAEDSSEEDRPSKKRSRPAQKKTNGVEPSSTGQSTFPSTDAQGLPPLFASQETPKLSADKEEKPAEPPKGPPPIQSLSLLDRLRLGGSSSFSSLAPVRTKQLTLDEIFAPASSSPAQPSDAPTPAQAAATKTTEVSKGSASPTRAAGGSAEPSKDSDRESAITRTPPKPKRRRVLADSDDSDSVTRSANRSRASTPKRSAPSTPQKPKPRGTPKKRKAKSDDDESDSAKDDDLVVEESPIASNRPRRAAAQAPKKYTVDSSDSSEGESDASEEASEEFSEAEIVSEEDD